MSVKQKLAVISLETAKSYANSVDLHNLDEALTVAKSVYETLSEIRKHASNKSLDSYLNQSK